MEALDALLNRCSYPKLKDPEPAPEQLENIYKAAFRAADHGVLRPWRFLLVRNEARERLGELFVAASRRATPDLDAEQEQKLRSKPLRAPLMIIVVSSPVKHPKVPEFEQDLSAAAAAQSMLVAAYAQGVGAMWRTGSRAYNRDVMSGLGLDAHEKIIGFLYLGAVDSADKNRPEPDLGNYFKTW